MSKGIGIFEVIIALSLLLSILTIVVSSISDATRLTRNENGNQERLESIFHTVDVIKSDLGRCGMRLQEAAQAFALTVLECRRDGCVILAGMETTLLREEAAGGSGELLLGDSEYCRKGREILIYHPGLECHELHEIGDMRGGSALLAGKLAGTFPAGSVVVALKRVELRYFPKESVLKRKADAGGFQPLLENVTDFYISWQAESRAVLYRIEVGRREQIRGYIFLNNMV